MHGLSRALGAGATITLQGETFHIKGKILRRYAEIEAMIVSARPDPMKLMREGAAQLKDNPEALKIFVTEMMEKAKSWSVVTGTEVRDWLNTVRGRCFLCYLAIQHNDPERLTLDKVSQMWLDELEDQAKRGGEDARKKKIAELETKVDQASGEDELGNSNGSVPVAGTEQSSGDGSSDS